MSGCRPREIRRPGGGGRQGPLISYFQRLPVPFLSGPPPNPRLGPASRGAVFSAWQSRLVTRLKSAVFVPAWTMGPAHQHWRPGGSRTFSCGARSPCRGCRQGGWAPCTPSRLRGKGLGHRRTLNSGPQVGASFVERLSVGLPGAWLNDGGSLPSCRAKRRQVWVLILPAPLTHQ